MNCGKCNGQLGGNAAFCPWCGAKTVLSGVHNNAVPSVSNTIPNNNRQAGSIDSANNTGLTIGSTNNLGQPMNASDTGGVLWGFLGFLISTAIIWILPIVGMIVPPLLIYFNRDKPRRCKSILIGIIISIAAYFVLIAVFVVLLIIWLIALEMYFVTMIPLMAMFG